MPASNTRSRKPIVLLSIAGLVAIGLGSVLFSGSRAPEPRPVVSPSPAPELPGPKFARFDVPNDKVRVRVVGQGFEVINTDPALTGTQVDFAGITEDGRRIPYSVKLPPPVSAPAEP